MRRSLLLVPLALSAGLALAAPPARAQQSRAEAVAVAPPAAQGQIEPAKIEAAQTETTQAETAQVEAAQVEPAKVAHAQSEAPQAEPVEADAVKAEPVKADAAKAEPAKADAAKTEEPKAEQKPPLAVAVETSGDARQSRLSFTLEHCVTVKAYTVAAPNRAILDLPEVDFRIDPDRGAAPEDRIRRGARPGQGLIASFRFGRLAPGSSRVVVDLAAPAAIVSASCADAPGASRLTLILSPTSAENFKSAARAPTAPPVALPAATAAGEASLPVIVIDPGHGGVDTGALGRDHAIEKNIVLDFARELGAKLRAEKHFRIVFTRDDDRFIPLSERVRIAREQKAELFVSIHADALAAANDEVTGATVYTVSDRASDAEAARIAARENQADAAGGEETAEDKSDVNDILFDLTRRETRALSYAFAGSLAEYFKVAARLNKNPRRSAGFVVLKAPDVPSILLELGYLSNHRDVADLTSPQWRDKATDQVKRAILRFFADSHPECLKTPTTAMQEPTARQ